MKLELSDPLGPIVKLIGQLRYYPPWVQFVFVCTLVVVLLATFLLIYFHDFASGQHDRILIETNVSIEVSVMSPSPTLPPSSENPCKLSYVREKDDLVRISPRLPYLKTLSNGGPICELLFWSRPFDWEFPNLDIKVVNNSAKTILLSQLVFEVLESSPDLRPVIVIQADRLQRNARHFLLQNEGWSNPQSCTITYGVEPWRDAWSQSADAIPDESHSVHPGTR